MATLLVAEHDNKTIKDATSKALTAAKAIGADVHVLIAGKDCKARSRCGGETRRREESTVSRRARLTSTSLLSRLPR